MPRFDGTGPYGHGPMTGCACGPCGMGMGFGRGMARGRRGMGFSPWSNKSKAEALKEYRDFLKEELKEIEEAERELSQEK